MQNRKSVILGLDAQVALRPRVLQLQRAEIVREGVLRAGDDRHQAEIAPLFLWVEWRVNAPVFHGFV